MVLAGYPLFISNMRDALPVGAIRKKHFLDCDI